MVNKAFSVTTLIAAAALAACGGAGNASGATYGGPPPTGTPQANVPIQQTVSGQAAFVNPSNNMTLYYLDVDTPTGGTCTGECLSVWPPLAPTAGASSQGGFTVITRSDGTGMQWAFKNHPLYMYSGDTGPDQANGNGIPLAGGHWHVARPTI